MGCNFTPAFIESNCKPFDLKEALIEYLGAEKAEVIHGRTLKTAKRIVGYPVSVSYAGDNNTFNHKGEFVVNGKLGFKYKIEIDYKHDFYYRPTDGLCTKDYLFN